MLLKDKLQIILDQRGWRPAELVRRSGVAKSKLSRMMNEGAVPTVNELVRIHRATGVPLLWLADDTLEGPPQPERTEMERKLIEAAELFGLEVALRRVVVADDTTPMLRPGQAAPNEVLADSADPPRKPTDRGRRSGT